MSEQPTGVLPENVTTIQKANLIRGVAERTPSFHFAINVLKNTGLRDRKITSIEEVNRDTHEVGLKERSFRNIGEHTLVVALCADNLADVIGLDDHTRNLFVTSALLHDVTKPLEISMLGYREMIKKGTATEAERNALEGLLKRAGVIDEENNSVTMQEIEEKAATADMADFFLYFDENINKKVLQENLKQSELSEKDQKVVLDVASSDTWGSLPVVVSRLSTQFSENDTNAEVQRLMTLKNSLQQRGKLPSASDEKTNQLSALLLYCDDMVRHTTVVSIDERLDEVKQRGAYKEVDEWGKEMYDGTSLFDAERIAMHAAGVYIKKEGVRNGTLSENFPTKDINKEIFDRIQSKVPATNSGEESLPSEPNE